MAVDLDHPAISGYLARLEAAAAGLPPGRREELVAEIRGHLGDALATAVDGDDAAVLAAVDRLGDPAEIVAAEGGTQHYQAQRDAAGPPYRAAAWQFPPAQTGLGAGWGAVELAAVIGLAVGVLTGGIGIVVGISCAWISDRWTSREKLLATVLGLLPALALVLGGLTFVVGGAVRSDVKSGSVQPAPAPVESAVPVPGGTP
jgi:uncharacterized membrane protein